ncbi:pyridoxal phosphate-dependent aminotransferase [Nitrosophilus kaiyonis]|uniref:pyridoxal phosphate-dependent aminotransferase n=1 Tax=Nitrosophilus kaiyonis TaxID=2930200 RepID=UPI002491D2C2|nr:aminotransferase class I/II-fold pyridoxal phosphate-dependent enzyme [Nitrosophilus kaiyonis]
MKRLKNLTPFIVMDIVKEASKFNDTIHFEIGQPDISPSPKVIEAAQTAIKNKNFSYTQTEGLEILREKIALHYKKVYDVKINPENILITPGTSGAFLLAYSLLLDINERIGFADPGYPSYKNFAYMLGIEPVFINVDKDSNYCITKDILKKYKIDALQISNPSNPTGNIYEDNSLKDLCRYCELNGINLISDELYHGLVYDKNVQTALKYNKNAIIINGFSKYFCMPGFRIGWIIVPDNLKRKAVMLAQNIFISAPTISQYAAVEAFDYEYLKFVNETFKKRRDFLYNELKNIFTINKFPDGAFYIWADISKYSNNSFEFSKFLLEKIHVAVTPGTDFGKNETKKYIRFSYTRDLKHLEEGVKRLTSLLC